jgi:hypothetical protein
VIATDSQRVDREQFFRNVIRLAKAVQLAPVTAPLFDWLVSKVNQPFAESRIQGRRSADAVTRVRCANDSDQPEADTQCQVVGSLTADRSCPRPYAALIAIVVLHFGNPAQPQKRPAPLLADRSTSLLPQFTQVGRQ